MTSSKNFKGWSRKIENKLEVKSVRKDEKMRLKRIDGKN